MIASVAWWDAIAPGTPYPLDVALAVLSGAQAVERRGRWFAARRRRA